MKANHRVAMLINNEVKGLLPVIWKEEEAFYDDTGAVSLENWCRTRTLSERDLLWILKGLMKNLKEGEAFLLQPGCYELTPDRIYLQPEVEKVKLCVRFQGETEWAKEMQELGRFFLEAIDYKEEDCVKLAYEFYHLTKRDGLRLEDYRDFLHRQNDDLFSETDTVITGEEKSPIREKTDKSRWIQIAAQEETEVKVDVLERVKQKRKGKKTGQMVLIGVATVALLVVLYQTGF